VIAVNPTAALYTPKTAKRSESHAMSAGQVELALEAVEFREQDTPARYFRRDASR
jgi:hypothetical protein